MFSKKQSELFVLLSQYYGCTYLYSSIISMFAGVNCRLRRSTYEEKIIWCCFICCLQYVLLLLQQLIL